MMATKRCQTKLIGFVTQTIKTPAIPISPTDDSCATMAVRSKDVETATTDVSMMHDDDDALVEVTQRRVQCIWI